jgi:hypothetical protein
MPMGEIDHVNGDVSVEVEEALAPVREITQLPVADHVEAFTDTHQRLRNLLTSPDDDPTAA